MKTLLVPLSLAAFLLLSLGIVAEEPKTPSQLAKLGMKAKLEIAKNMLDGLAHGDHGKIKANAEAMQRLNLVEYLVRSKNPYYKSQLTAFQLATTEMVLSAKKKNLEGATLAYTQMAASCVNCHKHLK